MSIDYDLLNEISMMHTLQQNCQKVEDLLCVYPGNMTLDEVYKRLKDKVVAQTRLVGTWAESKTIKETIKTIVSNENI